jgi:hypothetical protein
MLAEELLETRLLKSCPVPIATNSNVLVPVLGIAIPAVDGVEVLVVRRAAIHDLWN